MIENPKTEEVLTKPVLGSSGFKKSTCSENGRETGMIGKIWFNSFRQITKRKPDYYETVEKFPQGKS